MNSIICSVNFFSYPMTPSWLTGTVLATPVSMYPEFAGERDSWYGHMTAGVIEIVAEENVRGYGFVGSGQADASRSILDSQVRDLLVGEDVFSHRRIRDILDRARWHFGRSGVVSSLLSGIDLALWDLKGKMLGVPVYQLLGGPTRGALRTYLTTVDTSSTLAEEIGNVKVAMQYGPSAGRNGIRENVALVEEARNRLGDDVSIAIDCYMAWDVPYTRQMERELSDFRVAWIEEPVHPTDFDSYTRIASSMGTPISGGEHLYDLRDFIRLIESGVEIVQPDLYRVGGITVGSDVAAVARAHDRKLMCHGVGLPSYHFQLALEPALNPMCEYLDIESSAPAPWIFEGEPRPTAGELTVPDDPGFGYRIREGLSPGHPVAPIW